MNNHELSILSTTSAKEALKSIIPKFERETGLKVGITFRGGSVLFGEIVNGEEADLFIGPENLAQKLMQADRLVNGTRVDFARSSVGLAVKTGSERHDISTTEKLKQVLLSVGTISFSPGASGIQFIKALEKMGIADQVVAKRVNPAPGELVGAVVARGDADIGVQQISELLPVNGIDILDPPPSDFRQPILYGVSVFCNAGSEAPRKRFIEYLISNACREDLIDNGLEPIIN